MIPLDRPIGADGGGDDDDFESYRHYLAAIASAQVSPSLRDKLDLSGIVQETLFEAHRSARTASAPFSGSKLAWLRRILAHNLTDAFRAIRNEKRDVRREHSLDAMLAESSAALGDLLAGHEPSPSSVLQREERAVRVANALARLPEAQREAVILQYRHGWTLTRIGQHLGRSPAAVAGLLKRGIKSLRQLLATPDEEQT